MLVQAQTPNGYFPLTVGNKWYFYLPGNGDSIRTILEVSRDTLMLDGNIYAQIDRFERQLGGEPWSIYKSEMYLRQVGNIVYHYPDSVIFNFNWTDSTTMEDLPVPYHNVKIDTIPVFNIDRKTYFLYILDPYEYISYSDSIGFNALHALQWRDWTGISRYLKGCVLNGVIYGEIITNVDSVTDYIPQVYELLQNYPNPFNPITTIEFYLTSEVFVTLNIYNVKGQLIKTLVNSYLPPGRYRVLFESENNASSLFYYQFIAGGYVNTKKMILLK
jgi:hypothetical protein